MGAKRPDEGVLGRVGGVVVVLVGVLERLAEGGAEGVLERERERGRLGVDEAGVLGLLGVVVVLEEEVGFVCFGVLAAGVVVDFVEAPVCCGLRGCDLGGLREDEWGVDRMGDLWGVLGEAGGLDGVEVGFRVGGLDPAVFGAGGAGGAGGGGGGGVTTTSAAGGGSTGIEDDAVIVVNSF